MGAILAIFSGPFGTILTKIIEGLFIVGTLFGFYWLIQHQAATDQRLKDQTAILQQVITEQNDFIAKTKQLQIDITNAENQLNTTIGTITTGMDIINKYLSDPDTVKKDRPASDILKQVIADLSGQKMAMKKKEGVGK